MLKRPITYKNFNDETVTEIFYFNLSKPELVELELTGGEAFSDMLKRIVEEKDHAAMVATFKKMILLSFGKKSADGSYFEKDDEAAKRFSQSAAYDALFMELAQDINVFIDFIRGVMPSDMGVPLETEINQALAEKLGMSIPQTSEAIEAKLAESFSPPPPPAAAG